ncbi:MAG TPA: ferritin-like protein [Solirubrobacterales bacterium]
MTDPSQWSIEELHLHLMAAIELELLTIPPYLTAMYSLGGKNEKPEEIIRSVVMEEMMHMALAANVLNAVGGRPELTTGGYVPRYPAKVPFHEPETFQVSLQPYGEAALTTFLAIENPNRPGVVPPPASAEAAVPRVYELAVQNGYKTIGEFYGAIEEAIQALDARGGLFTGEPGRQIGPSVFHPAPHSGRMIEVKDLASAMEALELIVDQGEGDVKTPGPGEKFDAEGQLAHYYLFKELREGHEYLEGDSPEKPTGPPIVIDTGAILPMKPNLRAGELSGELRDEAEAFNATYTRLLEQIQEGIDGEPKKLFSAYRSMILLAGAAQALLRKPLEDGSGLNAGPTFEFVG